MTPAEQIARLDSEINVYQTIVWESIQLLDVEGMRQALAKVHALSIARLELIASL